MFDDERAVPDANDGGEGPEDLPPVAAGRATYTAQVRPWPSVTQQFRGPSYSTPRNYSVPTIIPAGILFHPVSLNLVVVSRNDIGAFTYL